MYLVYRTRHFYVFYALTLLVGQEEGDIRSVKVLLQQCFCFTMTAWWQAGSMLSPSQERWDCHHRWTYSRVAVILCVRDHMPGVDRARWLTMSTIPVMSGYPKAPCLDHSFFLLTLLRYPKFLGSITFSSNSMQMILNSPSRRLNLTTRSLLCNHAWSNFIHGFVKTEWLWIQISLMPSS